MSINAGTVSATLELDISRFTTGLQMARSRLAQFSSGTATANTGVANLGNRLASVGNRMTSMGKSMTTFVTAPILAAGVASVKLASDMNESMNKVEVAFGKSADSVKKWSDTTLKGYGIAKGTSLDMAALFGDMATSMSIPQEAASKMSMSLVGLAGDLASFKNMKIEEVTTALNGIFTGETESLKRMGVVMTEVNLQNYALSKGIKTKIKDMKESEKVQLRYNYVLDKTKNAHGDFARTQSGTANQMRIFTESLKELGASFGQHILPVITPIISKTNQLIQSFGKLDDKTKKTILTVAGITAVVGPTILVFGKMATAVSSIMTLFGGFAASSATAAVATTATTAAVGGATAATGGFATALAFITGPIGLTIGAIALLTAGGIALYKHLKKDSIPAVNLFGKTTSEATKKAVGAYMSLEDKATKALMTLAFKGEKITKENSKVIVETFDSMGKQIKEGMQKHFDESYKIMEDFLAKSNGLTSQEEFEVLEGMKKYNEMKKKEIDIYNQRIKYIYDEASSEHRKTTEKENQEISAIKDKMRKYAVMSLSATELESKAILERLRQQSGDITARQASEVIKNSKTQKDKTIDEANKQFLKVKEVIEFQRDVTGELTAEQADNLIASADRQRDGVVKKAEDMHKQVVSEATKQAGEHAALIDKETGDILTKWEVFKQNTTAKYKSMRQNLKSTAIQIGVDLSVGIAKGINDTLKKIDTFKASAKAKYSDLKAKLKSIAIGIGIDMLAGIASGAKNVMARMSDLKARVGAKWSEIRSNTSSAWNNINSSISSAINRAWSKVSSIGSKIKSTLSNMFKFSMPHIKVPHFNVSGKFSINPPSIPRFSFGGWYDKGGIFDRPSIIGVGERRPEFVGALDDLRYLIRDELRKTSVDTGTGTGVVVNIGSAVIREEADIKRVASELHRLAEKEKRAKGIRG